MATWTILIVTVLAMVAQDCVAHPKGGEPKRTTLSLTLDLKCTLCLDVMKEVDKFAGANTTVQCIEALADKVCKALHIEDTTVCREVVSEYGGFVITALEEMLLNPVRICGALFPGCGGTPPPPPNQPWHVPFLNTTKPPRVKPVLPTPDKPKLRILHLADLHFDKYYVEGSEADCGEPLCCRQTNATTVKTPAGKWGTSAKCDIPLRTLQNMFEHLVSKNDFDYVIWTGDAPPHNVWDQTKQDQLTVLSTLTDLFTQYFSKKVLISAVGNHESAPADNFPPFSTPNIPNQYSTAWLFQTFADQWTKFGIGTNPDIYQSIQKLASYVTKPYPGLRVISLNTMYCLTGNYWLYLNEYDPDSLLQWLINQLQDAENAGDKVHIIGHVPPGSSCLKEWSENYYDIMNRYENTITGLFYGHTHEDSFEMFYENSNLTDPIHVAYVAPSTTTYNNYWPSYRIYTIDGNYKGSSFRVLDHETYMLNLDEAGDNPNWVLEYSAKDAYNMSSLLPEAWNDLIQTFIQDDALFQKYNRFKNRAPVQSCTGSCKHGALCGLRSGRSQATDILCQGLPNSNDMKETRNTQLSQQDIESIRARLKSEFSVLPKTCQM